MAQTGPPGILASVRAALLESFGREATVLEVPDPVPADDGVVVAVEATGLCRSDWHAWAGHDPGVVLPHVPGHELAGTVTAVGRDVSRWRPGARVTVPFVCGCGVCPVCLAGDAQVCPAQEQPGFTHWGSFAELVALRYADTNLVALPDDLSAPAAASLGCRFATSYRALVARARTTASEWVCVVGCGGVGLSAVMVARSLGARVVAVDLHADALDLALRLGTEQVVDASRVDDVPAAVVALTDGGAHVSVDAVGSPTTCADAVLSLRRRGRHVQVGLLPGVLGHPPVPMERVIAYELDLFGSHGMAATDYPGLLDLVRAGRLRPDLLVTRTVGLAEGAVELAQMDVARTAGITVVDPRR